MAWTKEQAALIKFLENSIPRLLKVRGHLETRARDGDVAAGLFEKELASVQREFRLIRQSLWQQLGFPWPEEDDGEED